MTINDSPIILTYQYQQSADKLWNALVVKDQMVQWYFDNIPSFEPRVGFETSFIIENESRTFTHLWKVIAVEPQKKIVYNWRYKEYEGDSNISFDIMPSNGSESSLKITIDIIADFPTHLPEFKVESCKQGWHYFLNERLNNFLAAV